MVRIPNLPIHLIHRKTRLMNVSFHLRHAKDPYTLRTKLQKKCSNLSYTLQHFFTPVTIFLAVLYMDNDFHNDVFKKIFAVSFVLCKGFKGL